MSGRRGQDYYSILKLRRSASLADVNDAYTKLVRKYHPSSGTDPDEDMMEAINKAYEVLSDDRKREVYDEIGHREYVEAESSGYEPEARNNRRRREPERKRYEAASHVFGHHKTGTVVDESLYDDGGGRGFFASFREDEGLDPEGDEESYVQGFKDRPRTGGGSNKPLDQGFGWYPEPSTPIPGAGSEGEFTGAAMFAGEREAPPGPVFDRDAFECSCKIYQITSTGKRINKEPLKTRMVRHNVQGRSSEPAPDLYVLVEIEADELFCMKTSVSRHYEVNVTMICESCSGKGVATNQDDGIYLSPEEKTKHDKCTMCKGEGKAFGRQCFVCKGSGVNLIKAKIGIKKPSRDAPTDCKACRGRGKKTTVANVKNVVLNPDVVDREILKVVNDVGVATYESYPRRGPVHFEATVLPMTRQFHRDLLNKRACWHVVDLASNWTKPNLAIPTTMPSFKPKDEDDEDLYESLGNVIIYSPEHKIKHLDVAKVSGVGFGGKGTIYFAFRVLDSPNEVELHSADNFAPENKVKLATLSASECKKYGDVQTLGRPSSSYVYPYVKSLAMNDEALRARATQRIKKS